MQRKLRVWRLLPPRKCLGAHSSKATLLPARRAVIAAQSAALPPPRIRTSYVLETSTGRYFASPTTAWRIAAIVSFLTRDAILSCTGVSALTHACFSAGVGV